MTGSELISATITAVAGATFTLHKLGVLDFTKEKVEAHEALEPCPLHAQMTALVDTMGTQQKLNGQRHEQHEKDLKAGKDEFHEIREEISSLRIGVGVLLDRTGGRPDDFRRKK
jgi:hypothetical protein